MKKLLLIFMTIPVFALSQNLDSLLTEMENYKPPTLREHMDDTIAFYFTDSVIGITSLSPCDYNPSIAISTLLQYEKICTADTLKATCHYSVSNIGVTFITNRGEITIDEINDMGYECDYSLVVDSLSDTGNTIEFYFVKEPTFKGYLELIKTRNLQLK